MIKQTIILLLLIAVTIGFSGAASALDVDVAQKGPDTAKKGDNVIITCVITNKESEPIYNLHLSSQNFNKQFDVIKPGETKIYKYVVHIPTDDEVKKDFGADATVPNPFYIGGFQVAFNDVQGLNHTKKSNSVKINLVSGGLYDYEQLQTALYQNIYYKLNLLIGSKDQKDSISSDDAKTIAQKFIKEPGATAGNPKLVIMDGEAVYLVPVMLNGKMVGEIYIGAKTGKNMGGAGGVSNEAQNNGNNQLKNTGTKNNSGISNHNIVKTDKNNTNEVLNDNGTDNIFDGVNNINLFIGQ